MATLEDQVLDLLRATQSNVGQTRMDAELQLKQLQHQDGFAGALVAIGSHSDIATNDRLAALLSLKNFANTAWSPSLEDFAGQILVPDAAKEPIRSQLLAIVFNSHLDSKITGATASVISKIAKADFPEQWPTLLDTLIEHIPRSSDEQAHGILAVLDELLSDGIDEDQFYRYATPVVSSLREIAVNTDRSLLVRAHSIYVFRGCFNFVENLKDKEEDEIKSFTKGVCDAWAPFFLHVLQEPMPQYPSAAEEADCDAEVTRHWRGVTIIKTQVLLVLARIQGIFADIMPAQQFFEACWNAIQLHSEPYHSSYVDGDREGGLVNQYQLPYSFDFLVIEEIDYLQTLLEAPMVQEHLTGMRQTDRSNNENSVSSWLATVLRSLVTFSSISKEAEEMWELDCNVFLSEEDFAETNNTTRSVCAAFVWKISGWFPQEVLETIIAYVKEVFDNSSSPWKMKEATLFALQQVAEEFKTEARPADYNIVQVSLQYAHPILTHEQQLLRARAHIAIAAVLCSFHQQAPDYENMLSCANTSLRAINEDESDVVRTACIGVMRDYLISLPVASRAQIQGPVVDAIAGFLDSRELEDMDENVDLMDIILQTLRDVVLSDPDKSLDHKALDVLLMLVKYGAARSQHSTMLITEAFESSAKAMAAEGPQAYTQLCQKVLPSLTAALDIEDPNTAQTTDLTDVAADTLRIFAESAKSPLPEGFVTAAMPRLCRLIFSDVDFYIRQSATLTIKHMLDNDKDQVFNWTDPALGKNGLEMCFLVIGHLLGPQVDDASAAEVGELAVSIVEKADRSVVGTSMQELLQITAVRLQTAEHPGLIQSLSMVFAHLATNSAAEVVNFLANFHVGGGTALETVLRKWLENSGSFVGFETIKQSVVSIVALYRLHDPRIEAVTVHGDEIADDSSRIRTRSQAKTRPIRFTIVPAPLKMVKVLVSELMDPELLQRSRDVLAALASPGLVPNSAGLRPSGSGRRDDSDDEWEDEDEDEGPLGHFGRSTDTATQNFLVDFFKAEGADPHFQTLYNALTEPERSRLMNAVNATGQQGESA